MLILFLSLDLRNVTVLKILSTKALLHGTDKTERAYEDNSGYENSSFRFSFETFDLFKLKKLILTVTQAFLSFLCFGTTRIPRIPTLFSGTTFELFGIDGYHVATLFSSDSGCGHVVYMEMTAVLPYFRSVEVRGLTSLIIDKPYEVLIKSVA